jgi:hypothetical protein
MDVEALREQTPGCLHRVHLICAEAFASDSFTVLRPLEHLYVDCASVLPPIAGTLTEAWPPALQAMFTASRAPFSWATPLSSPGPVAVVGIAVAGPDGSGLGATPGGGGSGSRFPRRAMAPAGPAGRPRRARGRRRAPVRTRSATPRPRLARSGGAGSSQWRLR